MLIRESPWFSDRQASPRSWHRPLQNNDTSCQFIRQTDSEQAIFEDAFLKQQNPLLCLYTCRNEFFMAEKKKTGDKTNDDIRRPIPAEKKVKP
jgi:hypothetical protein